MFSINVNLKKCRVEIHDASVVCGLYLENELNLFHESALAQAIWLSSSLGWEPIYYLKIWYLILLL